MPFFPQSSSVDLKGKTLFQTCYIKFSLLVKLYKTILKRRRKTKGGEEAAQEKEQEEDEVRQDRRRNTIEHPLINYKIINCKDHYKPAHQI